MHRDKPVFAPHWKLLFHPCDIRFLMNSINRIAWHRACPPVWVGGLESSRMAVHLIEHTLARKTSNESSNMRWLAGRLVKYWILQPSSAGSRWNQSTVSNWITMFGPGRGALSGCLRIIFPLRWRRWPLCLAGTRWHPNAHLPWP